MRELKKILIGATSLFIFAMAFFPLYDPSFGKMLTSSGSLIWSLGCFFASIITSHYAINK
jgi:hypothetical protein|tara:strand:- start:399 stop:578 length:180 start_codon:yes stop_codon:yes gene_type:complete